VAVSAGESSIPLPPAVAEPVPANIKKLQLNGQEIWVLEGDQISQWVEQEGRLDHDQNFLPKILKHIKKGDVVIDIGAYIGDHTIAYSKAVGFDGRVIAFEPNQQAVKCLRHNTQLQLLSNVDVFEAALTDEKDEEYLLLSGNNGNWGGAYIGTHMPIGKVEMRWLDEWNWHPDLIKIDVEGYELKVLSGAQKTIAKHHPKLVIEINREALRRQGESPENIFQWLGNYGYEWDVMQENCDVYSPLFDILCLPKVMKSKAPLTPYGEMLEAINVLKHLADRSIIDRMKVMQNLRHSGLTPRWRKKKKARKKQ
jgi:FkbM family methyltransferase